MTVRRVFGSRSSVAELVSAGSELQIDGAATLKARRASLGRGTATDGHGLGLMFLATVVGWVGFSDIATGWVKRLRELRTMLARLCIFQRFWDSYHNKQQMKYFKM